MSRTRLVAISVAVMAIAALATTWLAANASSPGDVAAGMGDLGTRPESASSTPVISAPENLGPVPELRDLDGWLQTEGDSFDAVKGEITIVQFWTYSCHNCTATIPFIQDIYARHRTNGLEIIGVHAPEFEHEKEAAAVQDAANRLGVSWPIALDTDKVNFRTWQGSRRFWPRTYVIDQNGDIRFDRIGEGKYAELEATIAYLLENGP